MLILLYLRGYTDLGIFKVESELTHPNLKDLEELATLYQKHPVSLLNSSCSSFYQTPLFSDNSVGSIGRTYPACSVLQFGLLSQSSKTLNGGFGCDGSGGGELISSTGDLLIGMFAFPDANGDSLDTVLSAEWGDVFGVLTDLELLDDLSKGGTISGSVLSADSNFLSSLCHYVILYLIINNKVDTPTSKRIQAFNIF